MTKREESFILIMNNLRLLLLIKFNRILPTNFGSYLVINTLHYHLITLEWPHINNQCLIITIHRLDLLHVFTVWIYHFMDFMINYSNCSLCRKWRETFMMWVPFWRSVRITWWITMLKMFLTLNRHLNRRCLYNTYTYTLLK